MTRCFAFALMIAVLGAVPALAQDSPETVVRMNRIEGQLRQLSGQVEQLQFDNRQLREQVRKFQEDVEFRFSEQRGGRPPSAAQPNPGAPPAGTNPAGTNPAPARPARRSDAFDPSTDPAAPGTPRQLGTTAPTPPLDIRPAPGAGPPREANSSRDGIAAILDDDDDAPPLGIAPLDLGAAARNTGQAAPSPRAPSIATGGGDDARADYDGAYAYLMQKQYEGAEMAFRRFIQSHPRDRLVPDATYWLGESYLLRSRPREAAEQFLKVSTEFSRSAKAPDAMLKLGVALSALGAKDQACATFAELDRKYPAAAPSVRQGVDREQKRVRCGG